MNNTIVTIIITTKNEEKNITNCLNSILQQTYPLNKIEIIIVDNHSNDKTIEIINNFKLKIKNLYLFVIGPERSTQRNFGAKHAKGEYILYLDADMTLSPNVIKESIDKLNDSSLIGLYIPEIIMGDLFWSRVRRFERSFYDATVIDAVRFIKLKDFSRVDGFDESLCGPEDWDLNKKIKQRGKVDIIKAPLYHNEQEFNLKKYLYKKNYYGKSFNKYINKWGKEDVDIKRQFSPIYRGFTIFIEKNKWQKLIFHPFLTIAMLYLKLRVGIKDILQRKLIIQSSNRE